MQWQITNEIIARQFTIADAGNVFAVVNANRNFLREWLPWLDFNTSVVDSRNFILESIDGYTKGTSLNLGLWHIPDNQFIGNCGFHTIRDNVAKFGYWLDSDWQGKGIITKTCQILIDHIFNNTSVNEININAATSNQNSRAIAERLNFKLKEIKPKAEWLYDHHVDHAIYSLYKSVPTQ